MKNILFKNALLILLVGLTVSHLVFAQPAQVVKLIKKEGKYFTKSKLSDVEVNGAVVTVKLSDNSKKISPNYEVIRTNKLGFIDLAVPEEMELEEFASKLIESKEFDVVEYNIFGKFDDYNSNDTYNNNNYYADVLNINKAWDITMGSSNVTVAIIDFGLDWEHEDIGEGSDGYQNVYLNPLEDVWSNKNNPNTGNKIDNDRNGLVDDWKGWSFATNTNDVRRDVAHGTFVAGIIAAKTDNGKGISGIAGGKNNEGVKILMYDVGAVNTTSSVDMSVVDDAIIEAADQGAKIINMSFGGDYSFSNQLPAPIEAAISYAANKNVVLIASSGNAQFFHYTGRGEPVSYPAINPNVMAVGSSNGGMKSHWSNFGDELDVVGVGESVYSTTLNNQYDFADGTSFAAPQVSGIAALMLSVNPNLTRNQVKDIIESTAQKVGNYAYSTTAGRPNGTWNNEMGYGLVDAYESVKKASCWKNIYNQTISTNTQVNGCVIDVKNTIIPAGVTLKLTATERIILSNGVTVKSGATLEIDGATVTIDPEFTVEEGATFIIK